MKEEIITFENNIHHIPDFPTIPFIEGDGIGPDIWKATQYVLDSAVEKAYRGKKGISWKEIYAGEKAYNLFKDKVSDPFQAWLPKETIEAFQKYRIGIKGPLTTPIGEGIRSLNVALRQILDLYICLRPIRWFEGVPSPVKNPQFTDMVIFRENTEDIYAGIEFPFNTEENAKFLRILEKEFPEKFSKIRFPKTSGIGIKPISKEGTYRLVRSAIEYAFENNRESVTLVHKGNIMKFTEGAFRDWGYQLGKESYNGKEIEEGPWQVLNKAGKKIIIKDVIADAFLQQILTRPKECDVIATMNLNGDYISDALAACVGGIGIAPGGNLNDETGYAIFEATHGTAPKYSNQNKVNPSSLILSGEMLLRHLGWTEAANLIIQGMNSAISQGKVTYDFARLMENAEEISCFGFGEAIVDNMKENG